MKSSHTDRLERYPTFAALVCSRTSVTVHAQMVRFWNLYRKISLNVATFLESLISLLQVRTFAEVIWTEIKPGLNFTLRIILKEDDIC